MRILISKLRHIGDVLLLTPLLENLKAHYGGECEIELLINKGCEGIVENHALISRLHLYPRALFSELGFLSRIRAELGFINELRARKFDLFISLTEGERSAVLALLSGAKKRVGIAPKSPWARHVYHLLVPKQGAQHTIEANLDSLRALGIPIISKRVSGAVSDFSGFSLPREFFDLHPKLGVQREESQTTTQQAIEESNAKSEQKVAKEACKKDTQEYIQESARAFSPILKSAPSPKRWNFVHIHPVSRWLFKCVKEELVAEIIDRLREEFGLFCVITCSSDRFEIDMCKRIIARTKHAPHAILGTLSLAQISALNSQAFAFIGVDTAIMHLSAANDTPTFAFFGPSGAFHWGAWDNECKESGYKNRNGVQKMGRHFVYQESRPCVPCGRAGCNDSKKSDCLLEIPIDVAWSFVSEFIKGAR